MGRYNKMRAILAQERAFREEQNRLHEKHEEIDRDKVIVEKSTTVRSILEFTRISIKTIAGIALIIFAAIGIITLIYPGVRAEFISVLKNMIVELKKMI